MTNEPNTTWISLMQLYGAIAGDKRAVESLKGGVLQSLKEQLANKRRRGEVAGNSCLFVVGLSAGELVLPESSRVHAPDCDTGRCRADRRLDLGCGCFRIDNFEGMAGVLIGRNAHLNQPDGIVTGFRQHLR
jgi:hypothetical protein